MSADEDTYLCPACGKPFDETDRLFDFAIAAHEKQHAVNRNSPADLIRFEEDGLMWVCKICGDPLHIGEFTARQKVISHCNEKHGSLPGPSIPVTARDGRRRGSGSSRGFGEAVGDLAEAVAESIGNAIGKLLDN